jgi:hypothetical protein
MNAGEDLIEQRFDHTSRTFYLLLVLFTRTVVLYNVPEIMLGKVEQQPDFTVLV